MLEKVEKVDHLFRVLAKELEKSGQMKGIVAELTPQILKNLKEIKENG